MTYTTFSARAFFALAMAWVLHPLASMAQTPPAPTPGWARCAAMPQDNQARLACFDQWAAAQQPGSPVAATAANTAQTTAASAANAAPGSGGTVGTAPVSASTVPTSGTPSSSDTGDALQTATRGCADKSESELSRFWELEPSTNCGTFGIRGYRPISLSWIGANTINNNPTSDAPGHNGPTTAYRRAETRIQLSVRTKIASGMLTEGDAPGRDSLWFGYSQQSYWQLFNGAISRPFRSTDHEPELTYIYPTDAQLPGGWRLRYSGLSAVHQSNGQSLPLSRSWNRVVLMAGMEKGDDFRVTARAWTRLHESTDDDNPGISDYVGRAELAGYWNINKSNTVGLTVRHSLRSEARGSARLEWLYALGGGKSGNEPSSLRLHTQLFSGYGDSLLDYNRRRTVFSVGLSLVDF